MTTTNQPLAFVIARVGKHTGFCPGCEQELPVMFSDELYPHATPAAHPCLGDMHSRCEARHLGYRCQLAPHHPGKHQRQPSASSGLTSWDDHPHPNGGSCWTPSLCAGLKAVAELRTLAVRQDDHELSVRLDLIEATLKGQALGER